MYRSRKSVQTGTKPKSEAPAFRSFFQDLRPSNPLPFLLPEKALQVPRTVESACYPAVQGRGMKRTRKKADPGGDKEKTLFGQPSAVRGNHNRKTGRQQYPTLGREEDNSEENMEVLYNFLHGYYQKEVHGVRQNAVDSLPTRQQCNKLLWGGGNKTRVAKYEVGQAIHLAYRKMASTANGAKNMRSLNSPRNASGSKGLFAQNRNTALANVLNTLRAGIQSLAGNNPQPDKETSAILPNTSSATDLLQRTEEGVKQTRDGKQLSHKVSENAGKSAIKEGEEQKKAEGPITTLSLTPADKRQIIKTMLKEGKIPSCVVSEHLASISPLLDGDSRLNRLADGILATYDIIVQETSSNNPSSESVTAGATPTPTQKPCCSELSQEKPKSRMAAKKRMSAAPSPTKLSKPSPKKLQLLSINETISFLNKYTALTSRNKDHHYDLKAICALHKRLGLAKVIMPRCEEDVKSRERMAQVKEALLRLLYSTINRENNVSAEGGSSSVKCFIGGGNNSALVRAVMRERWWWNVAESAHEAGLLWTQWRKKDFINTLKPTTMPELPTVSPALVLTSPKLCNHLEKNYYLGNKKSMYKSLSKYYELVGKDVFDAVPLTFHIRRGRTDEQYDKFRAMFRQFEEAAKRSDEEEAEDDSVKNVWIVKPGENTNRGNGIMISQDLKEIENVIAGYSHTYIVQKYIERPLLYEKRKFDIRCFGLITSCNGLMKGYYYQEGYLRTSSKEYSVSDLSKSVHLTNEAIQIKYDDFGRHESGNKVSYTEFQHYLSTMKGKQVNLGKDIIPRIKEIMTDTMKASYLFLDKKRRQHTFELFGYDFMIDEDYKVYLIEVNINPCLGVTSSFSSRFITSLMDNTLRIAIDPLFSPPAEFTARKGVGEVLPEIKYELIFDQRVDSAEIERLYKTDAMDELNGESDKEEALVEEDYPEDDTAN